MKKIAFLVLTALILGFFLYLNNTENSNISDPSIKESFEDQVEESFIFVPYWTFSQNIDVVDYNNVIYFGITITKNGVDTSDEGYQKLSAFSDLVGNKKRKYLTLRIMGSDANRELLENHNLQKKIGNQSARIAKDFGFDGVVIDFETSAFGFASTEEKITELYRNLQTEIKNLDLEFIVVLFGDTYYRARPYNVKDISSISDKVIIMAYDFHKARLNPGPNFSFSDSKKYGYDFMEMTNDFIRDISFKKIIITLGYFGYDWKLDDGGTSIEIAESLSLNQINSRFLKDCLFDNCRVEVNEDMESYVLYEDNDSFNHEVWFESNESAEKKVDFLNNIGIKKIGSWAYSYY